MDPREALADLSPDRLIELLSHNPPWWVYALVALIPLSLCYLVREFFCWFWKVNQLVSTLERIEQVLILKESVLAPTPEKRPPEGKVRRAPEFELDR